MVSGDAEFDSEVIDYWLGQYPAERGLRVPGLDRIGHDIRGRDPVCMSLSELGEISDWKAGARTERLLDKEEVVRRVSKRALSERFDMRRLRELVGPEPPVRGYGFSGVDVPIASAILRFVFPDKYGSVGWRNWFVLSHTKAPGGEQNKLFSQPLLKPLSEHRSSSEIGISHYKVYLQVLRQLAEEHPERTSAAQSIVVLEELLKRYPRRTPAEIDMALFAYSHKFIPEKPRRRQKT